MNRSSPRPIAAVYHPPFGDFGGGEMVAAWTLQVLQENHDVILWCEQKPDFNKIDARFGTRLSGCPPTVVAPSVYWAWLLRVWPERARSRLLKVALIAHDLRRIQRRWRPRLWVSTCNEMWMPGPGLQYIHYPDRVRRMLPPQNWSLQRRAAYGVSLWLAGRLRLDQATPPQGHRSIANSRWTVGSFRHRIGGEIGLVYPPVPPFVSSRPWAEREDRVVCLGRWTPLKRMPMVVDVVEQARRAGAAGLRLAFAGFWDATEAERATVMRRCAGLDWIEWHEKPGRDELQELIGSSRYGLHAMVDEHFGIAVAELMTAGCVVFVHDSGGPPEIVEDRRQLYTDAAEGGRALHAVWSSTVLQAELHEAARPRGLRFSPEMFCDAMRAEIAACDHRGSFSVRVRRKGSGNRR